MRSLWPTVSPSPDKSFARWMTLSLVAHLLVLGMHFGERRVSMAVIPVEFLYTKPVPTPDLKPPEPTPPQPKAVPPAKKLKKKTKQEKVKKGIPVKKKTAPAKKEVQEEKAEKSVSEAKPSAPASRVMVTKQVFPFSYYARIVRQKIWREWDWNAAAGSKKTVVAFSISREGEVNEVKIKKSSGDGLFDQAARRAVQLAAPFPPLPQGYQEPSLDILFEFSFEE